MNDFWHIILESNLINFLVALVALIYFVPKLFKSSLVETKDSLQKEIKDLEALRAEEEIKLSNIELKLNKLETDSKQMVADAHKSAETLKAEIIKSAEVEITKMRETAFKDIEERKEASMQEIKEEFVKQAAKIVEHKFAAELNNSNTDMIAVSAFKSVNSMEANS